MAAATKVGGVDLGGGDTRQRVLFWKPSAAGSWLIGKVVRFRDHRFDGSAELVPIAVFDGAAVAEPGGKGWQFVRSAEIVLATELRARISTESDIGKVFAIRYDGTQPNESGGNDTRLFTVTEQTAEKLFEVLSVAEAQ